MWINLETWQNRLQWNNFNWGSLYPKKKPYLKYDIYIHSSNLWTRKITEYQLNLFNKICDLLEDGFTFKQVSEKLNKIGFHPTRGNVGEFTPQKVWSNYSKIKKNRDKLTKIYLPTINDLRIDWE